MSFAKALEDQFRGDIRFRGAAYLKAERVTISRVTPDAVFGIVQDGTEFQTQLNRENGQLRMHCTCTDSDRLPVACKHLWATILAADATGLAPATVRSGNFPPFIAETSLESSLEDYWDGDSQRDVYTPPPTSRVVREALLLQPQQLRGWEASLNKLSEGLHAGLQPGTTPTKEREIFYEIDVSQSRDRRQLVLQTSQRQRRTNGQWGKRKPLKLRPGQMESVEHDEDQKILAYLLGSTPERSNWYSQQAELQATMYRYFVPYELAEMLLPMMCSTNRLLLLGDEGEHTTRLQWDDGNPWELSLAVVPGKDADQKDADEKDAGQKDADLWVLEGRLYRDAEALELDEALLLLPGGFVFTRQKVARLKDFGTFDWVQLFQTEGKLEVPQEEGHEFVDRLLDMPELPKLDLPPELRLEEVRTTPVPLLTLHTPRGVRWQHERLPGDVSFDYAGARIRSSSPQGAIVQRDLGRCLPRDRAVEEAAWDQLQEFGFRRLLNSHRGRHDVEIPVKNLGPSVRGLIQAGWQVHAGGKQVHQPGNLKFEVKSGVDWFELHAQVDFEGRTVSFPELLSALARGDTTVRLDDGSLGILPEEWQRHFGLLAGLGVSDGDHMRFAQNQVGLLDALLVSQESVQYDAAFDELRQRVRNFDGIRSSDAPPGFLGELRGYQAEGFGWLKFLNEFRFGGCLADDMGLGKTIQLLALLQDRHLHRKSETPSLVVVPKSLIFNWQQECTKFTPELKVIEYVGLHRARLRKKFARADVILTTYGTMRRDILHLRELRFDYIVLDEAQAIKNAGSQVAKAARLLKSEHRIALTGTPIENHLNDLWSLFEFLNPGMLGRASIFKLQTSEAGDEESRKLLAQALRPFILRRTKREVARDLPDKVEQTVFCNMGKQQETLYNELRDHYRGSLMGMIQKQGLARSKIHVLEALLRLRQAACHPALLDQAKIEEPSAKLDVLGLQLQDLLAEGHKALVFSQFTSMLAIVKRYLDQRKIPYEYLDGQTRNRKERIEHFQSDPNCGVFLISLKAGGLGLNLTAADYVFLLDPWWNPAVEMQAIDRAHRLGQTRQVFAYRLICRNTVEEKIAELQVKKKDLADAILQADNNLIQDLSTEDLEMLLS